MANIVQRILQLARVVASEIRCNGEVSFECESVRRFVATFSTLTLPDLDFQPAELQYVPRIPRRFQAPVSFVNIFADQALSLQLFGLRDQVSRIPLHDHPGMHGFIKCIHGAVRVKSFDLLPLGDASDVPEEVRAKVRPGQLRNLVRAVFAGEDIVSSDESRVCQLTPSRGNVHEIRSASSEVAVIADVIIPPYTPETKSFFFFPIATLFDDRLGHDVVWLLRSVDSEDFHCETIPYHGPSPS